MEIIHYKTFQVRKWFYSLVFFYSLSSSKGTVTLQSIITQLAFKSYFVNNCVFSQDDQDKGTMQVNQCHGSIIYFLLLKRNKNHPTTVKKNKKSQNFILFHTNWLPRLLYLII